MAKRYGRNQRRRHRDEIMKLKAEKAAADLLLSRANYALKEAREIAFDEFLKQSGLLDLSLRKISERLGDTLGKELYPIALQILNSRQPFHSLVDFYLSAPDAISKKNIETLTGTIKPIFYTIALMR
mgnify:CR=1 FL=1